MARSSSGDSYSIDLSGPIFTGAIYGQVKTAVRNIEEELGDEIVKEVRGIDDRTFRNPTGHASSKVSKQRQGQKLTVDRSGLVYGPWLEDGGSRADIFKGYHAFQKARRTVDQKTTEIADREVERYVIRPNR